MKKIFISIGVLVIFITVLFIFNSQTSQAPTGTSSPAASTVSPNAILPVKMELKNYQITATAQGFLPQKLTVKIGDTVTFVNKSSFAIWPAAGPHPTHAICPEFDALSEVTPGNTYAHTFTKAITCPFHDHLHASQSEFRGEIIVTE